MNDIRNGIWEILKRFFLALLSTIGVFIVFGFVLDKLEAIIYSRLYASAGRDVILPTEFSF